jgi:hypothetical protein
MAVQYAVAQIFVNQGRFTAAGLHTRDAGWADFPYYLRIYKT